MHARVGTLYPRPGDFDSVVQVLHKQVIPAAQRQHGYFGFLVISNRQANKVIGTTLWDTEADMHASARGKYLQDQVSRLLPLLRRPPDFEEYTVDAIS